MTAPDWWNPPSGMVDPVVNRAGVPRYDWYELTAGEIADLRNVAVAYRLALYGNKAGTNCHPGVQLLADDLCKDRKTIGRALGWLSEYGWVTRVRHGAYKERESAVYQLTVPSLVLVEHDRWDNAAHPRWIERPPWIPEYKSLRAPSAGGNRRFAGDSRVPSEASDAGDSAVPSEAPKNGSLGTSIMHARDFSDPRSGQCSPTNQKNHSVTQPHDVRHRPRNDPATIAACSGCDERGWRLGPDGVVTDLAVRCDHGPATVNGCAIVLGIEPEPQQDQQKPGGERR